MKGDVKCSMDFFGRVVDGDPAVTQDFSPTPPFISAVAIPLAQREVEEKLMRMGLKAIDDAKYDLSPFAIQEFAVQVGLTGYLDDDTPALAALRAKLEASDG